MSDDLIQRLRGALADIAYSGDMTLSAAQAKARRVYEETAQQAGRIEAAERGSAGRDGGHKMSAQGKLPPLPESQWYVWCHNNYEDPYYSNTEGYTADETISYAEEAVRVFREADEALMRQALDFIVKANKDSQFWLVPESKLNKVVAALRARLGESK